MRSYDASIVFGGLLLLLALSTLLMVFKASLVKLRYKAIDSAKLEQLRQSRAISKLLDKAGAVVRVIRLGIVACNMGLGWYLYPVANQLIKQFDLDWSRSIILTLCGIIVFCLLGIQFFINDFLLHGAGGLQPEPFLRITARFVLIISYVLNPIANVLQSTARQILTLLGVNVKERSGPVDTAVQLSALGHPNAVVSQDARKVIENAIRVSELEVSDLLLPRNQIQYLNLNDPVSVNLDRAKEAGHTRFPLCNGGLDECIGIIHIKDLFLYKGDLQSLDLEKFKRQLITFKEDTPFEEALKKLMHMKIHMALVVDEFDGVLGAITLERLLEEIVGRIQDEFDFEDSLVIIQSENTYKVSGLAPIHEVEAALKMSIEHDEDVSTFGGLVIAKLGKIPEKNQILDIGDLSIRVNDVSSKGITTVTVHVRKRDEYDLEDED